MADIIEYQTADAIPTSVALANEPAWHGQGTVLDTKGKKGLTVEQALPASGLDWTVEKVPLYAPLPPKIKGPGSDGENADADAIAKMTSVRSRFGVQRQDTGEILGTVGETWQPVQNLEGFAILNDVIAQASALDAGYGLWIESAGALDNGRKVWVLAHIDQDLQIAGEAYRSYLLFMNGHDGRTSVTAAAVDMRVVCANTLNYAIYEENAKQKRKGDPVPRIVRVRHTTKAAQRIAEAHAILGMRNRRAEEMARQAEHMVETTMDDGAFQDFLAELMPISEPDTPAATMIADRRSSVTRLWSEASNLDAIRGTRWGALQAVIEYADHGRDFKSDETRLKAAWDLTPATIKTEAYELLGV